MHPCKRESILRQCICFAGPWRYVAPSPLRGRAGWEGIASLVAPTPTLPRRGGGGFQKVGWLAKVGYVRNRVKFQVMGVDTEGVAKGWSDPKQQGRTPITLAEKRSLS